ncbi:hypothetical protein CTA2_11454 [Colletotrichum tanaceti]|uniref:Zn(2)-C6 fungal-type domain-containing protein n=1 Tax=Colletotrichum tanaceti TaxID=1306861 RepID=A0A4U6XCF7_9PEZI|nr:hypothetical protein CTA2_11454 [Colletotrichum tanaceti]TKW52993.1 hypothetical protein CTA1_12512 [Colletotrichum tanaceti]
MKPRRCCNACRRRHRKCVVQPGAKGCGACVEAELECRFDTALRFKHAPGSAKTVAGDGVQKKKKTTTTTGQRARRQSERSRGDEHDNDDDDDDDDDDDAAVFTEHSSSPAIQPVAGERGGATFVTSQASPLGSAPYEGQLTLDFAPPTSSRGVVRAEAPGRRFSDHGSHGSHGDGSAPIGFVLNRGPQPPPPAPPPAPAQAQAANQHHHHQHHHHQHHHHHRAASFASSPEFLDPTRDALLSETGHWNAAEVQPQLQISYLLGDSSSTQPGPPPYQPERAGGVHLALAPAPAPPDPDHRYQPPGPEHCGFTGRQAFLFRTYVTRIAPSIDACHDARPFTLDVPRLALHKPILLNGIFALASRFDAQSTDADDGGRHGGDVTAAGDRGSDLESTYYHNRCIELVLEAFSQPPETWDSTLLTAVVIMRLYEEYDNEADSHYHHLRGTRNLLGHDAVARFVTQGGLAEAASWVHLRQALYVCLVHRTPIEICLDNFERSSTFRRNDDTAHANRAVYLFVKALKLFFPDGGGGGAGPGPGPGPGSGSESLSLSLSMSMSMSPAAAAWEDLRGDVEAWYREKPVSFRPLLYEKADVAAGKPFPTLWMTADAATVGLGYYYASKAIFSFQEYNSPNPTAGFEGTKKRMDSEREIPFYLCMVMGLALSNEAVNAYYLPAHMLSLCGHLIRHPLEREHTIKYLAQVRTTVQWKTGALARTLREQWAELDGLSSR